MSDLSLITRFRGVWNRSRVIAVRDALDRPEVVFCKNCKHLRRHWWWGFWIYITAVLVPIIGLILLIILLIDSDARKVLSRPHLRSRCRHPDALLPSKTKMFFVDGKGATYMECNDARGGFCGTDGKKWTRRAWWRIL